METVSDKKNLNKYLSMVFKNKQYMHFHELKISERNPRGKLLLWLMKGTNVRVLKQSSAQMVQTNKHH